jgi:hypothetical protein
MSRGPGIWQRAIMTALQTRDVIYLRDVLPSPYTTAQRLACVRAAHQLAHGRKINLYTTYQATILARSNIRITWDVLMRLELKQQGLSEAEINERRAIQQKYHTKTAMEHLGRYNNAHNVPWYDALLTAIGNDTP